MKKHIKKVIAIAMSIFFGMYSSIWNVYGDVLKDGHQVKGDGLQKFIK